ncbi:MAG: carbonic anhydrase [Cumulibacter sp.]
MGNLTPSQAWAKMREGNARFAANANTELFPNPELREQLAEGQHPFALVFGCSDSRAAAEILFDQGLGQLFVVRTAGHVIDAGVLGSIEFGIEVLNIPLIVVLGHDSCGAVKAAMDSVATGDLPGGYLRDIVERVLPSNVAVSAGPNEVNPATVGAEHVVQTSRLLNERSRTIGEAVDAGNLAIVGATYRLAAGGVNVETVIGNV